MLSETGMEPESGGIDPCVQKAASFWLDLEVFSGLLSNFAVPLCCWGVVILGGVPPRWGVTKLYRGEKEIASSARSGMFMADVFIGVRKEELRRLDRLQSAMLSWTESG